MIFLLPPWDEGNWRYRNNEVLMIVEYIWIKERRRDDKENEKAKKNATKLTKMESTFAQILNFNSYYSRKQHHITIAYRNFKPILIKIR